MPGRSPVRSWVVSRVMLQKGSKRFDSWGQTHLVEWWEFAAALDDERLPNVLEELPDDVLRLPTYEERAAGGMMTTEPVILAPDATVAEALPHVCNIELIPSLAALADSDASS